MEFGCQGVRNSTKTKKNSLGFYLLRLLKVQVTAWKTFQGSNCIRKETTNRHWILWETMGELKDWNILWSWRHSLQTLLLFIFQIYLLFNMTLLQKLLFLFSHHNPVSNLKSSSLILLYFKHSHPSILCGYTWTLEVSIIDQACI